MAKKKRKIKSVKSAKKKIMKKRIKNRTPSNKDKSSKIKKLMKIAKSNSRRKPKKKWYHVFK